MTNSLECIINNHKKGYIEELSMRDQNIRKMNFILNLSFTYPE